MTRLSIVIVSYNVETLLRECLQSIFQTAEELRPEIIVVDNASTDGSVSMLAREFPDVQVIANSENRGFARATNQGLACARGDFVLLLNPDTIVLPGALAALVRCMEEHPAVGAMGPKLLNGDRSLQPSCHAFPNLLGHFLDISEMHRFVKSVERWRPGGDHTQPCVVDWLTGACLLLRREAIRQVGVFDEDYFLYAEEMDWCYRARRMGWLAFFAPSAEIVHLGGGSSGKQIGRGIVQLYRSLYLFYRKHLSPWSLRRLQLLVFVLTLPKVLVLLLKQDGSLHRRDLLRAYWQVLWLGW